MNIYLAVLNDLNSPDDVKFVGQKIEKSYELEKSSFRLAENVYVIASVESVDDIAQRVGLVNADRKIFGVVCKLNGTFSGFNSKQLWRFLDSRE